MFDHLRLLSRIVLYFCIILSVAFCLVILPTLLFEFPIVIEDGPYVSGPPAKWPNCLSYAEFIKVHNQGLLPTPTSGWWVSDTYGTYHFPDRWLAPGEEIRVWSGTGHEDNSNLYAGRRSPVWVVSVSYNLSYFYKEQGIIWGQINCDPAF